MLKINEKSKWIDSDVWRKLLMARAIKAFPTEDLPLKNYSSFSVLKPWKKIDF